MPCSRLALVLVILSFLAIPAWAQSGPNVSGYSPAFGPPGTSITVTGTGFGASQGSSSIYFVTLSNVYTYLTVTSWSATSITATVPSGTANGLQYMYVSVGGVGSTGTSPFTVGIPPSISSYTPDYGPDGTSITVTGTGFGSSQGSSTIYFVTLSQVYTYLTVTSWSATSITATVPSGTANGLQYMYISVAGLNTIGTYPFTVGTPPSITSYSPDYGPDGTAITVTGTGFGASQSSSAIYFISAANVWTTLTPTSWSDTQIVAPVPSGLADGLQYMYVNVAGLTSIGTYPFTVGTPPSITSYSPTYGPAGSTTLTITGSGFGASQGTSYVDFQSTSNISSSLTPTGWSDTQIVVPIPSSLANGLNYMYIYVDGLGSIGTYPFTVGIPPSISNYSPASGPAGTSITVTGSGFGATQGSGYIYLSSWTSLTVTNWSDTSITATIPPGTAIGTQYIYVSANGLASIGAYPFTISGPPPGPAITGISPPAAAVTQAVTITGSNFGSSQGASTITFNGIAASNAQWSATSITVPVPVGASTGNVVVTVAGQSSNAVAFEVGTPPTITASVSPSPNAQGWYNSFVTVTFNCAAGSSKIVSCSAPVTVTRQGQSQTITGTVTDAAGISVSTSATVSLETVQPTVVLSNLTDQTTVSSSALTVSGTIANSLTAVNAVTCNGATASLSGDAFSCNISLNPGVNLVMVVATDLAGNMGGARLHVIYPAALPPPVSLSVTPGNANVLIGGTQQFTAVDQLGRPRPDATWTVSDTTIATISTDTSPILTGVAAGQVTLTASFGSLTAQSQVTVLAATSFAVGTPLWTAPTVAGFTPFSIVQAVPTQYGTPSLFSIEGSSGTQNLLIRAFTADGQQLWQLNPQGLSNVPGATFTPDNSGGLLIRTPDSSGLVTMVDIDGQTGTPSWTSDAPVAYLNESNLTSVAVGPDGGFYMIFQNTIVKVDPNSGQAVPLAALPYSTLVLPGAVPPNTYGAAEVTNLAIDQNGVLFLAYATSYYVDAPPFPDTVSANLLMIQPGGAASTSSLFSNPTYSFPSTGALMPDGQGGAFVIIVTSESSGLIMDTGTGVTCASPVENNYLFPTMVQGENGTVFITDGVTLASITFPSCATNWTWTAQPGQTLSIISSTAGNGLVAQTTNVDTGVSTVIQFDSAGSPTTDTWSATDLSYWAGNLWAGMSSPGGPFTGYSGDLVNFSSAGWPEVGEAGTNQAAQAISVTNFSNTGANQTTITSTLQQLALALPTSTCNIWLAGTGDPAHGGLQGTSGLQWTQTLISATPFGHGTFMKTQNVDYLTGAFSGNSEFGSPVPGLPPNAPPLLTINDVGAFFNAADNHGAPFLVGPQHYPGNTLRARLFILIHEEAHELAVAGFQSDFGIPNAGQANDRLVDANCRALIEGPSIKSLSPNAGSVGTTVTITGQGFGKPQGASTVIFNNQISAAVTSWVDGQIVVTVPTGAITGNIVVTVGGPGGQSASKNFTVQ